MPFDYREEYQRYQRYYLNLQRFYRQPVARVSIFVVISFMTVSFFSVFAIRPTLVTISSLIREIEDKREINSQLDQKVADLSRVQAEYIQAKADVPRVWRAMPDRPEGAGLIWEVEVTVGGNLVQVKEFMKTINSLGRVMVVKEATWATGTPFLQKEGVAITVSLRGEVYFTKEADAG